MKYWKIALVVLLTAVFYSAGTLFLLNWKADVILEYHTGQRIDAAVFPSQPMSRDIDESIRIPAVFSAGQGFPELRLRVAPLNLRQMRLDLPPHSSLQIKALSCRILGMINIRQTMKEVYRRGRPDKNMEMELNAGKTMIQLWTGDQPGTWEFRAANDMPRILPFILALPVALLLMIPVMLILTPEVRKKLKKNSDPRGKILIVFFLLMLILPTLLQEFSTGDERERQPEFLLTKIQEYPENFSYWYRYHLPFRRMIFDIHHKISVALVIPAVKDVIPGNDGWCFTNRQEKGFGEMPYADYMGTNLYSEQQLALILKNLKSIRDALARDNIRFIVYIAPNKYSIYGTKMLPPPFRRRSDDIPTKARQVVEYVRAHSDITIIYPEKILIEARDKMEYPIYYKGDTHWNYAGAYVGSLELLKVIDPALAAKYPSWQNVKLHSLQQRRGDLLEMMQAPLNVSDEIYAPIIDNPKPLYDFKDTFGYLKPAPSGAKGPRVFAIRDSFFAGMTPFLWPVCEQLGLYWHYEFNPEIIAEFKPDVVVLETVERLLNRFLNLPVVYENRGKIDQY